MIIMTKNKLKYITSLQLFNTVSKFGVSEILIQRECIKLIKCDSKDIYNITQDFYLKINAVLLNFLTIK